ncbi:hypothetical protein [Pseudomonas sp. zfem002]|uniref:hypothetical protein n=1 Tax=Pseudomonas sp. zfem002 TaxID=3078197 RepID=UPI002928E573|nr:hypothetical protein [Pseudomonas sp. zfem002]MDU9394770.1 hypothetical protein [Pseudomonas sp. zfem002]
MLDSLELLIVAAALFLCSRLLRLPGRARGRTLQIKRSLATVLASTAVTALLAAALLFLIGYLIAAEYRATTILALEQTLETYASLSAHLWLVLLAIFLVLALITGGFLVSTATARSISRLSSLGNALKYAVVLLASCGIAQIGAQQKIEAYTALTRLEIDEQKALQLTLFRKLVQASQQQLVSAVVNDFIADDARASATVDAYDFVREYQRYPYKRTLLAPRPSVGFQPTKELQRASLEKLMELYSTTESGPLDTRIWNDTKPHDLTDDITRMVFDESISDNLKENILGIENPLLDALVSAILDPLILDRLKTVSVEMASRALRGEWSPTELEANASTESKKLALARFKTATARAVDADSEIGEPLWNAVRVSLSASVEHGLPRKSDSAQNEARQVIFDFKAFWSAVEQLYGQGNARAQGSERLFQNYLLSREHYAALWGYGVITFAPAGLDSELKRIAVTRMTKGDDREAMMALLALRSSTNEEVQTWLSKNQLPSVSSDMTLEEVAEISHASGNSKPKDGFTLYFQETAPDRSADARDYFNSERVELQVGRLCPKLGIQE